MSILLDGNTGKVVEEGKDLPVIYKPKSKHQKEAETIAAMILFAFRVAMVLK